MSVNVNEKSAATSYLTSTSLLPPYLAYPRFLLDMGISETAKLVYAVLLDRARLSQQNAGWTDKSGHVFLYFTISNLASTLHKSEMTIKSALKVLSEQGMIVRLRQGTGMPNCIYVKVPILTDNLLSVGEQENRPPDRQGNDCPMNGKLSAGEQEICPSDVQETVCQGDKKLSSNNKEVSHSKREKRVSDNRPLGRYQNVDLTKQELAALQSEFSDWSERIERLSSYMASTGKKYQNHAATIRLWAEKDKPATARRIYECEEDESL